MFIGLAFNERNDAFDFNTALQDAKKEQDYAKQAAAGELNGNEGESSNGFGQSYPSTDYSLKDGEKIKVHIPGTPFSSLGTKSEEGNGEKENGEKGTLAFANFQAEFDENEYSPDPKLDAGKRATRGKDKKKNRQGTPSGGFMLKPSKKDTPARTQV